MPLAITSPTSNDLYEADFHAWTQEQARLLQARRFADLDVENLVEEVADLGDSKRDQIENRLTVLLVHLLKWLVQPEERSNFWRASIVEQRFRIARLIKRNPSLKAYPAEVVEAEYVLARLQASGQTGLPLERIPETMPFTLAEALDDDFLPLADGE